MRETFRRAELFLGATSCAITYDAYFHGNDLAYLGKLLLETCRSRYKALNVFDRWVRFPKRAT